MSSDASITARQLWGQFSTVAATPTTTGAWCTPLILPSGGIFIFGENQTSTLSAKVTFKLPCDNPDPILSPDTTGNSSVIGFSHPFYASISPQIFALAAATVISYVLVILIFITPRTFFVGGPGGGVGFLGRRGMIAGSYGSSSIVGIGRRPLLQKIATVTVAISLTIATADTFDVAEDQYNKGYVDSSLLVDNVVGSLEIRIIRVISDTFLWLAQVQTLIRLFPRHKEKVTIKWLGFAMVSFDTIFSILDSFVSGSGRTRPRSFQDAIPALNYLFELAISLIYASCVVYYCLSKRRFAFWHPKMKNICLVALLSLVSVVIPVVFFILDISQPDLAGWGEYIRWVGAAAASVVVWEWVERIESLERDERKDGILGREIFDGDEMLNMTPSEDASSHGGDAKSDQGGGHKGIGEGLVSQYKRLRVHLPLRKRSKRAPPDGISTGAEAADSTGQRIAPDSQLVLPQRLMTPPNRSDTGSVASTVYAIHYHNLTSPSPNIQQQVQAQPQRHTVIDAPKTASVSSSSPSAADKEFALEAAGRQARESLGRNIWQSMPNPFKRRRAEPPAEVADAQIASGVRRSPIDRTLNLRDRLGAFASAQRDRFASRGSVSAPALPVTVIPAPKTNDRTWSPDDLRDGPIDGEQIPMDDVETSRPYYDHGGGQVNHEGHGQVVLVSAPTHSRTWSPDDVPDAGTDSRPQSHVQRPGPVATRPPGLASTDILPTHPVFSPRGSLTIYETGARPSRIVEASHASSPRSTAYAPPRAIAPIVEDPEGRGEVGGSGGHSAESTVSPAQPETARPHNADQKTSAGADEAATSAESSPTVVANQPRPSQEQSQTISTAEDSDTDGRDTGGTNATWQE